MSLPLHVLADRKYSTINTSVVIIKSSWLMDVIHVAQLKSGLRNSSLKQRLTLLLFITYIQKDLVRTHKRVEI